MNKKALSIDKAFPFLGGRPRFTSTRLGTGFSPDTANKKSPANI